jgi:hypothetical protein
MDELTPRQAMLIVEARELLRSYNVDVDSMNDYEVLSQSLQFAHEMIGSLQQLRATLGAIAQLQQAVDGAGETPN